MRKTSENVFSSFKGSWRVSSSYFSKFALDHEQGFMPAVLMSCRRHKKLNFLIKFSNSIFIKFEVKVYWRWTCVQNKLIYKVSFYFQQFVCVPDVKKTKNVLRFYLTETPRRLRYEHVLELEAPRDPQPPLPPPSSASFYKIRKLNLCLKADISKTAWINAWWGVELEQINAGWAWEIIASDNKFAFSNYEKYIVLWAAEIYWATNCCSYLPNKG